MKVRTSSISGCFFFIYSYFFFYHKLCMMHESKRATWEWSWIVHGVRLGQVNQVLPGEHTPLGESHLSIGLVVVCLIIFSVCGELREMTAWSTLDWCRVPLLSCRGWAIVSYCGRALAFGKNVLQSVSCCRHVKTEQLFDRCQNKVE